MMFGESVDVHVRVTCCSGESAEADGDLSRSLNLVPYSQVSLQRTSRRRPVLFTPAALSTTVIQKILNMGGAMDFNICKPGQIWADFTIRSCFLRYDFIQTDIFLMF